MRCINLDWLEVYGLEEGSKYPCNAEYFRQRGYDVSERDYGTRVWQEMFTINDTHGQAWIEIRRNPASDKARDGGLFPKEACHIRLSNYACYGTDPIGDLRRFMAEHGYTLVKIFRIDIAMDFTQFDMGDKPDRFIRRYIDGRYSKINQANVAAHGTDTWQERNFNSLSWGAKKSMVSTKFYNKSLELSQVHDKPYIRYAWYLAGLITDPINGTYKDANGNVTKPDIWRVEFSINSSAKKWFVIEDCNRHKRMDKYMPHTLDVYDTREKLLVMFASLAHHYFHFKVYEEGTRKDRCKDKVLFKFSPKDEIYKIAGNVSSKPSNNNIERLIRYLQAYRQSCIQPDTVKHIDALLDTLRSRQVTEFCGNALSEEDIFALQRLIAERTGGFEGSTLTTVRQLIKTVSEGTQGTIW